MLNKTENQVLLAVLFVVIFACVFTVLEDASVNYNFDFDIDWVTHTPTPENTKIPTGTPIPTNTPEPTETKVPVTATIIILESPTPTATPDTLTKQEEQYVYWFTGAAQSLHNNLAEDNLAELHTSAEKIINYENNNQVPPRFIDAHRLLIAASFEFETYAALAAYQDDTYKDPTMVRSSAFKLLIRAREELEVSLPPGTNLLGG